VNFHRLSQNVRRPLALVALVVFLMPLASCSLAPRADRTVEPYPARRGSDGKAVSWASVLEAAGAADVILLGEEHTDGVAHAAQLKFLKEVLAREPQTALSLEFLERDEQPIIDRYLSGTLAQADFIQETDSANAAGPNNWVRWYQPLVDAAAAVKAPVVGANPPRYLAKLAREKGYEALKALPAQEQAYFTLPVTEPTPRERKRFLAEMREAAKSHGAGSKVRIAPPRSH